MAEYANNSPQSVAVSQPVLLNTVIGCNKGYVLHREGSGILTLRGATNGSCNNFARYQVLFKANIGIPSTETAPASISTAITLNGEVLPISKGIVTAAAVVPATPVDTDENYNVVVNPATITVPSCCCVNISVENTSDIPITVKNANLVVTRIA